MSNGNQGRGIPAPEIQPNLQNLKFSFKHLDAANPKFPLTLCDDGFLRELLLKIKEFSGWTVDQFIDQNNNEHRHIIFFPETSEPEGFTSVDLEQFAYHESWQFQISQNQHWRVHGVLIEDTFYVVWLDPDHRLYAANAD